MHFTRRRGGAERMLIIKGLNADESRIAIACVRAIAEGPWFPPGDPAEDQELQTVLGFTREELREIHKRLLAETPPDQSAMDAIGQCLNNLTGFPAPAGSASRWVAAQEQEVEALCDKWFRRIDP